jgi:hypothetical protein
MMWVEVTVGHAFWSMVEVTVGEGTANLNLRLMWHYLLLLAPLELLISAIMLCSR